MAIPKSPPDRAALLRVMADAAWERPRRRKVTEYWRGTDNYKFILKDIEAALTALEAAGYMVQRLPPVAVSPAYNSPVSAGSPGGI